MTMLDIDFSRGFDLLGASGKVREHLDGSVGYEAALAFAQERHLTLRYWVKQAEGE